MKSIRVQNLRSFKDSEYIEIKPITIFVGLNSSGKSSFLRIFPLLRQSTEKKTSGPVLWYGDYVDFGSYSDSLRRSTDKKNIIFSFQTNIQKFLGKKSGPLIEFHIGVNEDSEKNTFLSHFEISCSGNFIRIEIQNQKTQKILLNGNELSSDLGVFNFSYGNNLVPGIVNKNDENDFFYHYISANQIDADDPFFSMYFGYDNKKELISKEIYKILDKYFRNNTNKELIIKLIRNIPLGDNKSILISLKNRFSKYKTFIKKIDNIYDDELSKISSLLLLSNFEYLLIKFNRYLYDFSKSIRYIAPIRANVERYYRRQDLQVDEVDPTGANIPMVLRSFTTGQKERFENWTEDKFNFIIRAHRYGGQYEVKIRKSGSDEFYNITDMGFGYSQMVPIIVSLWLEIYHSKKNGKIIFAIEQPELHLHPGYQALISDIMCNAIAAAKESKIDLKFVVETHSEALVNRLGMHIESKLISCNDAAVYIFEKDIKDKVTSVTKSSYDNDGYLENWPYGFFEVQ